MKATLATPFLGGPDCPICAIAFESSHNGEFFCGGCKKTYYEDTAEARAARTKAARTKAARAHTRSETPDKNDTVSLLDRELRGNALDGERFRRTDAGNGELFAHLYGERLRYDHRRGRWLVWRQHWWAPDADGELQRLAKDAARRRYQDAGAIDDLKEREAEARFAIASESRQRLDAALALARSERPIADAGEDWDSDPWAVAVANGVIDLRTGELRPGRQEDRLTMHAPVRYDPAATATRWLRFLDEIFAGDAELVDFIQRAAGYSLTGDVSEQALFVAHGSGANGKTTFVGALRRALGDYAYNAPFSTVELRGRSAVPADVAALAGRRFVTASETNANTRLNEARVKALTGGDPITARHLFSNFFTFQPVLKLWLSVNHRPSVQDSSYGFWRRVRLIPFTRQFSADEQDRRLDAELAEELPGILAWAVAGCLAWQERGLEPPATVRAATESYRADSDPIGDFLAERCVTGPDVSVGAAELFRGYKRWAESQGMADRERLGARTFGTEIGERFERRHARGGNVYVGVALSGGAHTTPPRRAGEGCEGKTDAEGNRYAIHPSHPSPGEGCEGW